MILKITKYNILLFLVFLLHSPMTWCIKKIPISALYNEADSSVLKHLQILSSDEFSGRKFSSKGSLQSQLYLVSTLQNLGVAAYKNQYRHTFTQFGLFQNKQGTNVIAYIPGSSHDDQYIVLSAHYDHLGSKHNKVFNGADDNASGTAALLHYAKKLSQTPLKHSVILLFTDGEEINLLGAKAFVAQQKNMLNKFKLNINLDMIAGSKRTKKLRFISQRLEQILSTENLTSFDKLQHSLKSNSLVQLTLGFRNTRSTLSSLNRTNWIMASDHGVFSKAGIPFIYFGVGTHKNYHSEHDDFDNINQGFYLSALDVIYQQLIFLDTAMSEQQIKPTSG